MSSILANRVARAILRNDGEAEDVMQDAYVRTYEHLGQFAGRVKFSTWLTRIAVHDALMRRRRGNRYQELGPMSEREEDPMEGFPMSTIETANVLKIREENVKVRLHGARALLLKNVFIRAGVEQKQAFHLSCGSMRPGSKEHL